MLNSNKMKTFLRICFLILIGVMAVKLWDFLTRTERLEQGQARMSGDLADCRAQIARMDADQRGLNQRVNTLEQKQISDKKPNEKAKSAKDA